MREWGVFSQPRPQLAGPASEQDERARKCSGAFGASLERSSGHTQHAHADVSEVPPTSEGGPGSIRCAGKQAGAWWTVDEVACTGEEDRADRGESRTRNPQKEPCGGNDGCHLLEAQFFPF